MTCCRKHFFGLLCRAHGAGIYNFAVFIAGGFNNLLSEGMTFSRCFTVAVTFAANHTGMGRVTLFGTSRGRNRVFVAVTVQQAKAVNKVDFLKRIAVFIKLTDYINAEMIGVEYKITIFLGRCVFLFSAVLVKSLNRNIFYTS